MEGERETSDPKRLLGLSEQLLRQRDYSGCRNYALQAQHSDPHLAVADQIIAVADVLLASQTRIYNNNRPNYYSILQLKPLSQDLELMRHHFKRLLFLLNPIDNELCFANEAFKLVYEAWSVLSDPRKKADYDDEVEEYYLQHREEVSEEGYEGESKGGNNGDGSFWTACPYCYYVYEYQRVYVDCCLRCQNCGRGFHGVVLPSPPPLVPGKDQYYFCVGFFPLGFSGNGEREMGEKNGEPAGNVGSVGDGFVEISDDSGDSSDEFEIPMGFSERPMNVNTRKSQGEVKNSDKSSDKGEFVMQGSEKTVVLNAAKERPMMRKKTVARNTKKIMGTGNRGRRIEMKAAMGEGRVNLNVEAGKEGEEHGIGSIGGMERGSGGGFVIGGVEYFEGDDDILVGLPIVDDEGNGKVQASS